MVPSPTNSAITLGSRFLWRIWYFRTTFLRSRSPRDRESFFLPITVLLGRSTARESSAAARGAAHREIPTRRGMMRAGPGIWNLVIHFHPQRDNQGRSKKGRRFEASPYASLSGKNQFR